MLNARCYILLSFCVMLIVSCTGSRKYYKGAERLEKQGLVGEAAAYYLEALERKKTSTDARIKLKEVGQKYVSGLASEFFRDFNTQQYDASLETFEKMQDFCKKANALNITLDYPRAYEEDYQKAIEIYCSKNYNAGYLLVNQRKYSEAQKYLRKVEKYNASYKNTRQLSITAFCEPLYQNAINNLESKNYASALNLLTEIKSKSEDYKDSRDLLALATSQQQRSFILFEPKSSRDQSIQQMQEYLYSNFNQTAVDKFHNVLIINNSPFQSAPGVTDLNNSNNLDLVQAIRKATGADYFYIFDVSNKKEYGTGPSKTLMKAYQEVVTRVNDSTTTTEYKPVDYYKVKTGRTFSYDFKYKLINAYTNQIVSSLNQTIASSDDVEYNQFVRKYPGTMNSLYPYNPSTTGILQRTNPKSWRQQFDPPRELKSFEALKTEAYNKNNGIFMNVAKSMR